MKTLYCPSCGELRSIEVKNEKETYPVKGEFVEIDALVSYCTHCGEQILDIDLDDQNLKTAFRQYRKKHKLLQPEEIKAIRDKFRVSQATFSRILGFGEKTITRYESGTIQDEAQNNLMVLVSEDIDNFASLVHRNSDKLTSTELAKVKCNILLARQRELDTFQPEYQYSPRSPYNCMEVIRRVV